jgi:hypothetical protein
MLPKYFQLGVFIIFLLLPALVPAGGNIQIIEPPITEPQSSKLTEFFLPPELVAPQEESENKDIPTAKTQDKTQNAAINTERLSNGSVVVTLPEVQCPKITKTKLFHMPLQRAVIAWNGKNDKSGEEIMILTSEEYSATGLDEAAIGIIPLPGKPLNIKRLDDNTLFENVQNLLDVKIPSKGKVVVYGPNLPRPLIAAHTVFVIEFEKWEHFADDLTSYIQLVYKQQRIRLELSDDDKEVIKKYWDKGFRYFAFDVSSLFARTKQKLPLLLHFKSTYAYYPLAISAAGGTERSLADLVVMTPGMVYLTPDFEAEAKAKGTRFTLIGNTSVDFTLDEVKSIDERLAEVFDGSGLTSVSVRNFTIPIKDIGDFNADFGAVSAE